MSTQSIVTTASRRLRIMGPAFALGGFLWMLDFGQIIVNGFLSGALPTAPDPELPLYLRLGLRLFVLSVLILNLGLGNLLLRTWSKSRVLSTVAAVFMTIAIVLGTINTMTLTGLAGTPFFNDTFMGLSVFATSIATGLLSIAALRTQTLSRRVAFTLLFIGLTTIPVLFGTPLPIGPDWATDHLAFLTSGLAYAMAGAQLRTAES